MKPLCSKLNEAMINIKKNNKQIILFGAGVIASAVLPYYLEQYDLESQVAFCVDNSTSKHGKYLDLRSKSIPICSASRLNSIEGDKAVIIITSSVFESIINQLDEIECLKETEYCIFPLMLIENNAKKKVISSTLTSEPLIPKTIHYIWIGGCQMPELLQKCINTWKRYCPDYEIICWNEKNYDFSKTEYMKYAYNMKKWAFVSDYARLDILNEYGGIYMDTDVELLRNLDNLLYQTAFCSVEKWNVINTGGCCGTVKNGKGIKAMLDFRDNVDIMSFGFSDVFKASGYYETMAMIYNGYKPNGSFQRILDMNIYPYDFFHPFDYITGIEDITENTFSVHHLNGGWVSRNILNQRKNLTSISENNWL